MKRYILVLVVCLFCLSGLDSRQAMAYSVKLEKNGMYVDQIPDSILDNVCSCFKKSVKKALQYDKKYKDADNVTIWEKVPDTYRYFIPLAKKIKDTDEIVIKNPFFLYQVGGNIAYEYWFTAEKNGKQMCLFYMAVDTYTGSTSFCYDKLLENHMVEYSKTMDVEETLYYKSYTQTITYAETPKNASELWNKALPSTQSMIGGEDPKEYDDAFLEKSYSDKKKEIFDYMTQIKKGKVSKKSDKDLKLQLDDEYVGSAKDTSKNNKLGIVIVMGLVVVGVITVGVMRAKKRKNG